MKTKSKVSPAAASCCSVAGAGTDLGSRSWLPAGVASKLRCGERGDVGVELAGHHPAVVGERLGDRQGRVAGEHPDLQHPARAASCRPGTSAPVPRRGRRASPARGPAVCRCQSWDRVAFATGRPAPATPGSCSGSRTAPVRSPARRPIAARPGARGPTRPLGSARSTDALELVGEDAHRRDRSGVRGMASRSRRCVRRSAADRGDEHVLAVAAAREAPAQLPVGRQRLVQLVVGRVVDEEAAADRARDRQRAAGRRGSA